MRKRRALGCPNIQNALKDFLGGTNKEMMKTELDEHPGYEKSECSDNDDSRNGYKRKQVNSSYSVNVKPSAFLSDEFYGTLEKMQKTN